jgi:hypothetical protein
MNGKKDKEMIMFAKIKTQLSFGKKNKKFRRFIQDIILNFKT